MNKKTLVIGASENIERYSNMAVRKLTAHHYNVVAIGKKAGKIDDVVIETEKKNFSEVHTITLYINPTLQKEFYNYIIALKPTRIIFNPGTENEELEQLAIANNIKAIEACTLVMLNTGQY